MHPDPDRERQIAHLLAVGNISRNTARRLRECQYGHRCKLTKLCPDCWAARHELLVRAICHAFVQPTLEARKKAAGAHEARGTQDARFKARLTVGTVKIRLADGETITDVHKRLRIAQTIRRRGQFSGGITFATLLLDRVVQVSVFGVTGLAVQKKNPQPRSGSFTIEWSSAVRAWDLPEMGVRAVRRLMKQAQPKPEACRSGMYSMAELDFRSEAAFGSWKGTVKARGMKWLKRPEFNRSERGGETAPHADKPSLSISAASASVPVVPDSLCKLRTKRLLIEDVPVTVYAEETPFDSRPPDPVAWARGEDVGYSALTFSGLVRLYRQACALSIATSKDGRVGPVAVAARLSPEQNITVLHNLSHVLPPGSEDLRVHDGVVPRGCAMYRQTLPAFKKQVRRFARRYGTAQRLPDPGAAEPKAMTSGR